MNKKIQTLLAVLIVCAGIVMLGYPWFSNWLYSHSVDSEVKVYEEQAEEIDSSEKEAIIEQAIQYNNELAQSRVALTDPFEAAAEGTESDIKYEETLSLDDSGLMCFVDIPKIDVYLPVYHGTGNSALSHGAGHLEGSTLPVGGESTRAVISAHTGINTSKMFSDLTELEEGDLFFIHVLDETLAYRVCDIEVILPEDTDGLVPETGRDLVSLLTCTPYGVNSHRLVVTGERTEYTEAVQTEADESTTDTDSQWMKAYKKALIIGICIVAAFFVILKCCEAYRKTHEKRKETTKEKEPPV